MTGSCDKTNFLNPAIPNVLYQINSPATFVKFEGFKDQESLSNRPYDGYTYCGERTYAILTPIAAIKYDTAKTQFEISTKEAKSVGIHDV